MRWRARLVTLAAVAIGAVGLTTQPTGPIPVNEVIARGIVGVLGQPLGKRTQVSGIVIDGNTLGSKADVGLLFLRTDRVDDLKLDPPVLVELTTRGGLMPGRVIVGQRASMAGYETGGYEGLVYGPLRSDEAHAADLPFHFHSRFMVQEMHR